MITIHPPRRMFSRIGVWASGLGLLGHVGAGALFALPMLSVATPAQAVCTSNGVTGYSPYTYTAATLNSDATVSSTGSTSCPDSTTTGQCYGYIFGSPTADSSTGSLPVAAVLLENGFTDSTAQSGVVKFVQSGATISPNLTVTVKVDAGQAVGKAAGTYTLDVFGQYQQASDAGSCTALSYGAASDTVFTFRGTATFIVPVICSLVSTPTISFGDISSVGPTTATLTASGGVSVNCPSAAPYTIYLGDGGDRIAGGSRQMANGAGRLSYQLFKEAALSNVWDATGIGAGVTGGTGGVSLTGTGADVVTQIYAAIPSGTTLPTPGAYTDSVVVTVAY